ncbi:transcriptional regulator ATRX homolog isoform X2 [Diabrotica virgifera virgifera]|nr:transcriptional regulator ATRX homolog isoform X2 [Diabrotica virgifera virgifera]
MAKTRRKNKKNPQDSEVDKSDNTTNDKLIDTSQEETAVEETTVEKDNKDKEDPPTPPEETETEEATVEKDSLTTQEEIAAEETTVENDNKNKEDPLPTPEETAIEAATVEKDKNRDDSLSTQEEIAAEETTVEKDNKNKEDSLTTQEKTAVQETTMKKDKKGKKNKNNEDPLTSDAAENTPEITAVEETTIEKDKKNKNKEGPLTSDVAEETRETTAVEEKTMKKDKKDSLTSGAAEKVQEKTAVQETTIEKDKKNKNKEDPLTSDAAEKTQETTAVEETTMKKDKKKKNKEDPLTSDAAEKTQETTAVEETTMEKDKKKKNKEDPLTSDAAEKEDRTEKDNVDAADAEVKTEPPRIRLVDLNKLIDPNIRKKVTFDSSIIVLSSSDEENSVPQVTNTKNTRSNSKKSSENVDNKSKSNSTKRKDKNSTVSVDADNEAEIKISDSESDSTSRKSKRLKSVQNNKVLMRESLKAKFKRPSKTTNKKSAADKSDGSSSDSDHEKSKTSKRSGVQPRRKSNDVKLNSKVYVPLPLYGCDKMKEVFNKNQESFAVLSVEKLKLLRKSKRGRKSPGDSSSDTEKSRKKKSKTTVISDDSDNEGDSSKTTRSKKTTKDVDADLNDDTSNSKKSGKRVKNDKDSEEENPSNKDIKTKDKDVESGEDKSSKKSVKTKEDDSENNENVVISDSEEEVSTKKNKKSQPEDDKTTKKGSKNKKAKDAEESKKKTKTKKGSNNNSDAESVDGDKKSQSDADSDSPSTSSKNGNKKKKTKNSDSSKESEDEDKVKDKNDKSNKTDDEDDSSKKISTISSDDSDADTSVQKVTINSSDSETEDKKKKTITLDSSDSDDDFATRKKEKKKELSKKKKVKIVLSDSDESDTEKKAKREASDSEESDKSDKSDKSESSSKSKKASDEETVTKSAARKRIRNARNSSSDSDEEVSTRRKIRQVLTKASLSATTKQAEADERDRKARIAEKQKKYNRIFEEKKDATVEEVVLDYDPKTKEPVLEVHKKIVKNLKPHQVSGIQFMYDACFESLERIKNSTGSGCILAHCMGLGKTLQVISLTHTLLNHSKKTKVDKVMVVAPINTVLNWKAEYKKWMPSNSAVEVYELATSKKNYERAYTIETWHQDGGVLIIGYNLFRLLSNPANKKLSKKMREKFQEGLVDPGPDLVICDEGHLLKNEKTNLSIAMNRIKTSKRIVLTGTPLQNNLKEYWCMVQFIKPNLLGTYKEYMNRFVNPITNGQYTDSTYHDIQLMRKRSHVLHKLLDGVVQRRDYSVLEPYLPPKHEYVIFLKLSDVQVKIYKTYMEKYARKNEGSNRTSFLFNDFQQLQRICTHPRVLLDKSIEKKEKLTDDEESEGSLKDFIDDGDQSSSAKSTSSGSESGNESDGSGSGNEKKRPTRTRLTRARAAQKKENGEEDSEPEVIEEKKEWFQEFCDGEEMDNIKNSGKLTLLFEILKECEEIGDKVLVFSQSLYALNCIEYFLAKVDEATEQNETEKVGGYKGSWSLGLDYFRLDGSSSCDNRAYWCESFNNPENTRARLFLISTKAGGLGINLVSANRVIIFDVSWNPSHDVQSIYRVYRFGQIKPSYIYRFVTYGAMEMKIYERQVTKQAISKRVIDEQQIDRHYNQNDLQELYNGDLEPTDRPLPMVPKDVLLGEMLQKYENIIFKYHLHQSLLENKEAEGLNEEERKAAWEEFENEKVLRKTSATTYLGQAIPGVAGIQGMSAQAINSALMNIVRRDNPTWSEHQIKGIIPALVKQLQVQIEEQDMSMYQRVVQEINLMQQARLKESMYQQQMMKLYQQQYLFQKQQQAVLGNMKLNPQQLQSLYGAPMNPMNQMNYFAGNNQYQQTINIPSTSSNQRRRPQDVIELND